MVAGMTATVRLDSLAGGADECYVYSAQASPPGVSGSPSAYNAIVRRQDNHYRQFRNEPAAPPRC